MNKKKAVISWLICGLIVNIWLGFTCCLIFRKIYFIPPIIAYRNWTLTLTSSYILGSYIQNFIMVGIFVFIYDVSYKRFVFKGSIKEGLIFGFVVWLIGWFVPLIKFYWILKLSTAILLYWFLESLVIYLFLGCIISKIYKNYRK